MWFYIRMIFITMHKRHILKGEIGCSAHYSAVVYNSRERRIPAVLAPAVLTANARGIHRLIGSHLLLQDTSTFIIPQIWWSNFSSKKASLSWRIGWFPPPPPRHIQFHHVMMISCWIPPHTKPPPPPRHIHTNRAVIWWSHNTTNISKSTTSHPSLSLVKDLHLWSSSMPVWVALSCIDTILTIVVTLHCVIGLSENWKIGVCGPLLEHHNEESSCWSQKWPGKLRRYALTKGLAFQ